MSTKQKLTSKRAVEKQGTQKHNCLPCRLKKKRCDKLLPWCFNCVRSNSRDECVYEYQYPNEAALVSSEAAVAKSAEAEALTATRDPSRDSAVPSNVTTASYSLEPELGSGDRSPFDEELALSQAISVPLPACTVWAGSHMSSLGSKNDLRQLPESENDQREVESSRKRRRLECKSSPIIGQLVFPSHPGFSSLPPSGTAVDFAESAWPRNIPPKFTLVAVFSQLVQTYSAVATTIMPHPCVPPQELYTSYDRFVEFMDCDPSQSSDVCSTSEARKQAMEKLAYVLAFMYASNALNENDRTGHLMMLATSLSQAVVSALENGDNIPTQLASGLMKWLITEVDSNMRNICGRLPESILKVWSMQNADILTYSVMADSIKAYTTVEKSVYELMCGFSEDDIRIENPADLSELKLKGIRFSTHVWATMTAMGEMVPGIRVVVVNSPQDTEQEHVPIFQVFLALVEKYLVPTALLHATSVCGTCLLVVREYFQYRVNSPELRLVYCKQLFSMVFSGKWEQVNYLLNCSPVNVVMMAFRVLCTCDPEFMLKVVERGMFTCVPDASLNSRGKKCLIMLKGLVAEAEERVATAKWNGAAFGEERDASFGLVRSEAM